MPRGQTYRDVHVDRSLSNYSVAHWQDTSEFVSQSFFNVIPVNNASDTYTTYPQGYFNRLHDTRRAEEAAANRVGYKTKEETYSVKEDALRIFISDKKRANADSHRNLDVEGTQVVTNALMMRKEKDFADNFLVAANAPWTIEVNGDWQGTTGDPVKEVLTQSKNMLINSGGRLPNKGIISYDLYIELRERADILERVTSNGNIGNANPAQISLQALATLFELEELVIMKSVLNQAVDGIEDPGTGLPPVDNVFLASEFLLLCHVPPGAGLYTATAGNTFAWNQYINMGLQAGPAVRRYRESPAIKGEWIEAELCVDQKVVSPDLGILFHGMLTT